MKIAFVVMNFPVSSETFVQRDISCLKRNGSNVDVYTLRHSKSNFNNNSKVNFSLKYFWNYYKNTVVRFRFIFWGVYVFKNEHKFIEKIKLCLLVPRSLKITDNILKNNYDVVHLYWGHYPSLVGLMLKHENPKLRVSQFLGAYDLEKNLEISKKMVLSADLLWTHAKGNIEKLRHLNFPRTEEFIINYRGLDLSPLSELKTVWSERQYDFITVSRLIEGKGIMECLRAALELKKKGKKFKYVIVGDGPLYKECFSFIHEHKLTDFILLLGYQPIDEVFKLMGSCRYFILLSEKPGECLPNVIKEAMMHQCYILSARSDNINELIINSDVGLVIERSAHDKIVYTLKLFLEKKIKAVSSLQKSILKEHFNIEETTKKYLQYWKV
jgi:glycosyltransferase involved in cell wall biosynthesis